MRIDRREMPDDVLILIIRPSAIFFVPVRLCQFSPRFHTPDVAHRFRGKPVLFGQHFAERPTDETSVARAFR